MSAADLSEEESYDWALPLEAPPERPTAPTGPEPTLPAPDLGTGPTGTPEALPEPTVPLVEVVDQPAGSCVTCGAPALLGERQFCPPCYQDAFPPQYALRGPKGKKAMKANPRYSGQELGLLNRMAARRALSGPTGTTPSGAAPQEVPK